MASQHGRSDSSDTVSSAGSSYQLILDHILTYPGSYEMPLRTMYSLNCAPPTQFPNPPSTSSTSSNGSPLTPQGSFSDDSARQTFADNLVAQLAQVPSQPPSLPPSFITSFVRRCFPPDLVRVDFPQALTGLDYLKDLEMRRRREVRAAMERLDIDRDAIGSMSNNVASRDPVVLNWVKSIEEKERKVDALYTQLYVGLRRWILINELSLLPFNKHNCVAMLNTLYPPMQSNPPTTQLSSTILKKQREGFFRYIQSVERNGPRVLGNLMEQGKAVGDVNGWGSTTRILGKFLQLANSIITECVEIRDPQTLPTNGSTDAPSPAKQPRKVDSGISFNTTSTHSTRSNSIAEPLSPTKPLRSLTSSSSKFEHAPRSKTPSGINTKPGTALERLARGLRAIGRGRTDATEMIPDDTPPAAPRTEKTKTLRKMRSMGAINGDRIEFSARNQDAPPCNTEEMRWQRLKHEAEFVNSAFPQRAGRGVSHEV